MESFRDVKTYRRVLSKYLNFYQMVTHNYKMQKHNRMSSRDISSLRIYFITQLQNKYSEKIAKYCTSAILDSCPTMSGAGVSNETYYKDIKKYHCNILHNWNRKCEGLLTVYYSNKYLFDYNSKEIEKSKIIKELNSWRAIILENFYIAIKSHMKVAYEESIDMTSIIHNRRGISSVSDNIRQFIMYNKDEVMTGDNNEIDDDDINDDEVEDDEVEDDEVVDDEVVDDEVVDDEVEDAESFIPNYRQINLEEWF